VDPDTFKNEIDFPKRPTWNHSMTKEQLDQRESEYFKNWLKETMEKYPTSELSWFEKNLEVWRQL
jgi:hypothetical protein